MSSDDALAVEANRSLEKLNDQLGQTNPSSDAITQALEEYDSQIACEIQLMCDSFRSKSVNLVLQDLESAGKTKLEDQIWNAHLKVNTHFRAGLRKLNAGGNAKIVERRKYGHEYLRFIKSSQKYYRVFIRTLNDDFGGIEALEKLAAKFSRDDVFFSRPCVKPGKKPSKDNLLNSCFRSLIQLGDLSRYRETELAKGEPNWAPAVGFYDLARSLVPSSGIPYNQLAIIALAESDLHRAVYWLYRAIALDDPHPQADQNLRRAFSKVSNSHAQGKLEKKATPLVASFLLLLAQGQTDKISQAHSSLEIEYADQLSHQLGKTNVGSPMRKIVLISFAATEHAQQVFTDTQGASGSFDTFVCALRLTLRTIVTVFKAFKDSLQLQQRHRDLPQQTTTEDNELLSTALALARLSMLWISKNRILLTNSIENDVDHLQNELWEACDQCIKAVRQSLTKQALPVLGYLLDEDEDTLAFKPLLCDSTRWIWYLPNGHLKPIRDDVTGMKDEVAEMHLRMHDVAMIGKDLANDESTPLQFSHHEHRSTNEDEAREQVDDDPTEVEAERMVTDLVGGSLDTLPDRGEPVTPAVTNPHIRSSTTKDSSSYIVGSSTTELMSTTARRVSLQRKEQAAPAPHGSRLDSTNMHPRRSSLAQRRPVTPSLRPTDVPMTRDLSNHSHALSNDSINSFASGNGTRRSSLAPEPALHDDENDHGMGDSLLFGAGTSPWSMTRPEAKRLSGEHRRRSNSPRLPPSIGTPIRKSSFGLGASAWDGARSPITGPSSPRAALNVYARPFK